MNKKGEGKGLLPMGIGILVILGIIVSIGMIKTQFFTTEPVASPTEQAVQGQSTGATTIVTTNPTVSFTAVDAQSTGTAVTFTLQQKVAGGAWGTATSGTTTAVPGQSIEFLVTNNTIYHNAYVPAINVAPGSFPKTVLMNKNASVTESIYNTVGVVTTNGGGATNQTALGNGKTYNLKDEMTGSAQASTQDMVCVIELTSGVNASTSPQGVVYGLNTLISTGTPAWYTPVGTSSRVWLFEQAAISSGSMITNNIQLNSLTTGALSGRMIKTCYTKENFIDTNKGSSYDVADSLNVVKSMGQYAYTVYIQ